MITSYDQLTPAALAQLGFDDAAQACHILQNMAGHDVPDRMFDLFLNVVTSALVGNADPDRAVANLGRLADASGNRASLYSLFASHPPTSKMVLTILAASQFLSDLLIHTPEYMEVVTNPHIRDRTRTPDELWADMTRRVMISKWPNGRRDALRRFKPPEVLRIAVRDILGFADLKETVTDISAFADACVRMALQICSEELGVENPPFAVIAMGKLGGYELNYSSDIDLIFVHEEKPGFAAQKLAEGVRDTLARPTDAGFVFRVDLRLRPEGRFGPITRTVDSCRTYYDSWAEPWERQALLKARVVAGDADVGRRFMDIAVPFVYRQRVESSFVEAIRSNKRRIEQKTANAGENEVNVKEGVGGVRDPEFAVQLLQLIAGGKRSALRTGNTLDAIERLRLEAMLSDEEAAALTEGYAFARNVEHRLQLMDELPVRCIPSAGPALEKFGKRLGYPDGSAFLADYRMRTAKTRQVFLSLFYGKDNGDKDLKSQLGEWLLAGDDPDARQRINHALVAAGYDQADSAEQLLRSHVTGSQYGDISPEARDNFAAIAASILDTAASTSDPLEALRGLESLARSSPSRAALYRTLRDSPTLLDRLCRLAAGSQYLWQILLQHPEFLDVVADEESLIHAANGPAQPAKDAAAAGRSLLRSRLAAGAADLWDITPTQEVAAQITAHAEWALNQAIAFAHVELATDARLAVIGMGKLGGRELSYGSDLDVMYVCDAATASEAKRIAERLARWLQTDLAKYGIRYEVDPRLRPDGRKGNLVLDIDSYRKYYQESAATWERHALIKARGVAGDRELCRSFEQLTAEIVYGAPWTGEQLDEVRAMKRRIETERLQDVRDIKLGPGGLLDIEWTTQLLQLQHGVRKPKLRPVNTLETLRALRDDAKLTQADWEVLSETYVMLTALRNHRFLKRGVSSDTPDDLPDKIREAMATARTVCLKRFFGQ